MDYQRDYISRLENQLFFCTFNPINNPKMNNNLLKYEEDNRIVEIKDSDNSDDHESNYNSNQIDNNVSQNLDNQTSIEEENHPNIDNNQNSQLVLYNPSVFHQILTNSSNYRNFINGPYIDNSNNNDQIDNHSGERKINSINNIKNYDNLIIDSNSEKKDINGNILTNYNPITKKRISINSNGTIKKQINYNNDIKIKRRASTNNIPCNDKLNKCEKERPRRKCKSQKNIINNTSITCKSNTCYLLNNYYLIAINILPSNQFIYSYGNPMFNNYNNLLDSSDESTSSGNYEIFLLNNYLV